MQRNGQGPQIERTAERKSKLFGLRANWGVRSWPLSAEDWLRGGFCVYKESQFHTCQQVRRPRIRMSEESLLTSMSLRIIGSHLRVVRRVRQGTVHSALLDKHRLERCQYLPNWTSAEAERCHKQNCKATVLHVIGLKWRFNC